SRRAITRIAVSLYPLSAACTTGKSSSIFPMRRGFSVVEDTVVISLGRKSHSSANGVHVKRDLRLQIAPQLNFPTRHAHLAPPARGGRTTRRVALHPPQYRAGYRPRLNGRGGMAAEISSRTAASDSISNRVNNDSAAPDSGSADAIRPSAHAAAA